MNDLVKFKVLLNGVARKVLILLGSNMKSQKHCNYGETVTSCTRNFINEHLSMHEGIGVHAGRKCSL